MALLKIKESMPKEVVVLIGILLVIIGCGLYAMVDFDPVQLVGAVLALAGVLVAIAGGFMKD